MKTKNKQKASKRPVTKAPAMAKAARKPAAKRSAGGAAAARAPGKVIDPTRILVRDVMRTDVLVLRADDPVKTAAEQLEEIHASGAPVVDSAGRLVGVLTLSDIARSEHVSEDGVTTRPAPRATETLEGMVDESGVDEEFFPTEDYEEGVLGRLRVADWMTPGVIKVAPTATIASACRRMLDDAIHRVFVVEKGRLVGVLSTEDVVRLLAEPGRKAPTARPAR
jgi:CBS domain-containing protein